MEIEIPSRGRRWPALLAIGLLAWGRGSSGQDPAPPPPPIPPPLAGFAPRLPSMPPIANLAPGSALVEGLGETVGAIEVKVGQGRFVTLREDLVVGGQPAPFLAVGDPSVVDFYQVGPRQLRLIGKKLGTTDLSVTTGSGRTFGFEVQVVADLDVLRAQLRQMFPDAVLQIAQLRTKVIVEGQARDSGQVLRIMSMIESYVRSVQQIQIAGQVGDVLLRQEANADPNAPRPPTPATPPGQTQPTPTFTPTLGGTPVAGGTGQNGPTPVAPGAIATNAIATNQIQVINLIRVPTSQQVLLKVRVAELNRTSARQIGADFLATIPQFGDLFGTQIGGSTFLGSGTAATNSASVGALSVGSQSTFYGTFSKGQFNTVFSALSGTTC